MLGFYTRECRGAGLGCGPGGQPQKTPGWLQAQPGLRTLAVAPHSFALGAPFCRRMSWETAVSSVLFGSGPLRSPLLFGPTSFLSESSAGPLFLGYLRCPQHSVFSDLVLRTALREDAIPVYRGGTEVPEREGLSWGTWPPSGKSRAEGLVCGIRSASSPAAELLEDRDCAGSFPSVPTAQAPKNQSFLRASVISTSRLVACGCGMEGGPEEPGGQRAFVLKAGKTQGGVLWFLLLSSFEDKGSLWAKE